MGLIDDFTAMVQGYPVNKCLTEIVDFTITSNEQRLDVGETFQFKVRIHNNGNLDMRNVKVMVLGTEFADVCSFPPGSHFPFVQSTVSLQPFNIDADNVYTTSLFWGKAKNVTNGVKQVVSAKIYRWDASLDHILLDHTIDGPEQGTLSTEITRD